MAPHLSLAELDLIAKAAGEQKAPKDIHALISAKRRARKVDPPKIWAVRRAVKGTTHLRDRTETRGRKAKMTPEVVRRCIRVRKQLVRRANAEYEVTRRMVCKKARVRVHPSTCSRHMNSSGIVWRRLREKPPLQSKHEESRLEVCGKWRKKPAEYWCDEVDLIIDAKKFPIPTSAHAVKRLRSQRVRGVFRAKHEGLDPGMTKPSARKHKFNPGGQVHILAGVCNDRIVLWEEIRGRWCASAAAAMYAGPIKQALEKHRPGKRSWLIMEDNDPAGFKSSLAREAKKKARMKTLDQPAYSPDLNPLDFSIWAAVSDKALKRTPVSKTVGDFKQKLRRVALRLPRQFVKKAVMNIREKAQAIFEAGGKHVRCD